MSSQTVLAKAEEAAAILQSVTFAEVFAALDRECVQAWRNAATLEEREMQHTRQHLLFEVRHELFKRISEVAEWERKNVPVADERGWCKLYKTIKEKFL